MQIRRARPNPDIGHGISINTEVVKSRIINSDAKFSRLDQKPHGRLRRKFQCRRVQLYGTLKYICIV